MYATELSLFLLFGYLATVAIELPILYLGLSPSHSRSERVQAGFMLTAFTYPVVVLVLPATILPSFGRAAYLLVAETFAPLAEVLFFRFITNQRCWVKPDRDAWTIVAANLLSFALGAAFLSDWLLDTIRSL